MKFTSTTAFALYLLAIVFITIIGFLDNAEKGRQRFNWYFILALGLSAISPLVKQFFENL